MLKDKDNKPYPFQPPKKIGETNVEYLPSSITEFRGKLWVTLITLDENDDRIWEFCLDDGKIIKTKQ